SKILSSTRESHRLSRNDWEDVTPGGGRAGTTPAPNVGLAIRWWDDPGASLVQPSVLPDSATLYRRNPLTQSTIRRSSRSRRLPFTLFNPPPRAVATDLRNLAQRSFSEQRGWGNSRYKVPGRSRLRELEDDLQWALDASLAAVKVVAGFPFPDFEQDYEFV